MRASAPNEMRGTRVCRHQLDAAAADRREALRAVLGRGIVEAGSPGRIEVRHCGRNARVTVVQLLRSTDPSSYGQHTQCDGCNRLDLPAYGVARPPGR